MRNKSRFIQEQYRIENPKFLPYKSHSGALRIVAKLRYKMGIIKDSVMSEQLDKLTAKHYID